MSLASSLPPAHPGCHFAVKLDLYSHVVPTLQKEAAREIGNALLG
jgi:hypothetical protein